MKRALLMALLLALALAMPLGFTQPARAATCYSYSCDTLDPQAAGCAGDAYTRYEYTFRGYRVELRVSPKCWAAWTRATYVSGNAWLFAAYLEASTSGGLVQEWVNWNGDSGWSHMRSFSYSVRACATSNTGSTCGPWA